LFVTENTPERLVIIEPVPATGIAFTWVMPLRLTLKLLVLKTPALRELASQWVPNQPTGTLDRCRQYPWLRQSPLGAIACWVHRFQSERATTVNFEERMVCKIERGFFATQQHAIPFDDIEALCFDHRINWKDPSPTDYYRIVLKTRGKQFVFFEHMDRARVEELLRGLITRIQQLA
jgi:hypothetical protein